MPLTSDQTLPPLREDLDILKGPRDWGGSPTWVIHDPLSSRYAQVDERGLALLNVWHKSKPDEILSSVWQTCGIRLDMDELDDFYQFLLQNQFVVVNSPALRKRLAFVSAAGQMPFLTWLAHKYLFFRIPLVRPDRFLDALYRLLRPLLSAGFVKFTAVVGALALFMTMQRWSELVHAVPWFFSIEGVTVFALTLVSVKICHELGHGLMCKHYDLRVPTMGVAFMVMWPVLYTDATEAWRLHSRRQRALIDSAGVITELLIACYALFFWALLPDGLARSVALTVATTTLVLSLFVNLNPFMRFDGYYFLSDLWNIPNLQTRGFALARWQMRKWLFGIPHPPPEVFPIAMHRWVVVYAFGTWIYRFFLFLGIALLVYNFFFKALGVILFLVEIWWFLVRPIVNEMKNWSGLLPHIPTRRRLYLLGGVFLLLVLGLVPWRSEFAAPARLSHAEVLHIYPSQAGRIARIEVKTGDPVQSGQVLFRMEAPELAYQAGVAQLDVARLENRISRAVGNQEMLSQRLVIQEQLAAAQSRLEALQEKQSQLLLQAPVAGRVGYIAEDIHSGRWVAADQHLMTLLGTEGDYQVVAWVNEDNVSRIQTDRRAAFYTDGGHGPMNLPLEIKAMDAAPVTELSEAMHASLFGGGLPVQKGSENRLIPEIGLYRVRLKPLATLDEQQRELKGWVRFDGERRSLLGRFFRWVAGTLIRESGF